MTGVLTFAIGARPIILGQPEEVREANIESIPEPARRAQRRSVLEHGVHAPEVATAVGVFTKLCDDMDTRLAGREWLAGDSWSLADACLVRMTETLADLEWKGVPRERFTDFCDQYGFGSLRERPKVWID